MSLRDPSYQAVIELGEADTEFVNMLKDERQRLREERCRLPRKRTMLGARQRRAAISARLTRIEELLSK